MKTYGSAVLTALQAQYKSLDEIEQLVQHRRLQAFIKGGNSEEWLIGFWKNIAITESERCRMNLKLRN